VEHLIIPDHVEVYEINGPYFFGIANRFEEVMNDMGSIPAVRIIRMRKVPFIDSTGVHNLTNLCKKCLKKDVYIVLSGVNPKVMEVLTKSGFDDLIGKENICSHITIALERSRVLAEGLKRD
jgi:SulP family sulfate permease